MWSNNAAHTFWVWKQNGTATLEDSMEVSYEVEPTFTIRPSNSTSRYLAKRNKNLCSHRNLLVNGRSSVIPNHKKNWKQFKWEYYPGIKRNKLLTDATPRMNHKSLTLSDKGKTQKATHIWFHLYDVLWEKKKNPQNFIDRQQIRGCQNWQEGKDHEGMTALQLQTAGFAWLDCMFIG